MAGGYLYFHACPDEISFDQECRRLLKDLHLYDVLRSDKSIASNGLEPRTPFLDRSFVQTYLSIPTKFRYHPGNKQCEKYLIRKAFDRNFENTHKKVLPREVLWRTKEAFSDGVSGKARSWYEIIQEMIPQQAQVDFSANFEKLGEIYPNNTPTTVEQYYYRTLFESFYGKNASSIIPYFWMPKFVAEAKDASARTLKIYQDLDEEQRDTTIVKQKIDTSSDNFLMGSPTRAPKGVMTGTARTT